jgi:hypothetical protein
MIDRIHTLQCQSDDFWIANVTHNSLNTSLLQRHRPITVPDQAADTLTSTNQSQG